MHAWMKLVVLALLAVGMGEQALAKNILLIIADDVAVDQLGVYGVGNHIKPATPTIDALASAGVMFTQAWSTPACSPTRASIFTGLHPYQHGVGSPDAPRLDLAQTSLPDVLPDRDSALIGKWHLGGEAPDWPIQHGWATHRGALAGFPKADGHANVQGYYFYDKYVNGTKVGHYDSHKYFTFESALDAEAWIQAQPEGSPWFATIAFYAAHSTTQTDLYGTNRVFWEEPPTRCVPSPSSDTGMVATFHNIVSCMDWTMGQLFRSLARSGDLDDTVIIFLGDNGTHNNGVTSPAEDFCCTRYYDYQRDKGTVYQGGVHVPMIITDGADLKADYKTGTIDGRVVSDLVHVVDLFPTIQELAGFAPAEPVGNFDAASLAGYLDGTRTTPVHTVLYTEAFRVDELGRMTGCRQAVRDADYKLLRIIDLTTGQTQREVYALSNPSLCSSDCELENPADELLSTGDPSYASIAAALESLMPHQCDVL